MCAVRCLVVRPCVRACLRACVRACVRACMRRALHHHRASCMQVHGPKTHKTTRAEFSKFHDDKVRMRRPGCSTRLSSPANQPTSSNRASGQSAVFALTPETSCGRTCHSCHMCVCVRVHACARACHCGSRRGRVWQRTVGQQQWTSATAQRWLARRTATTRRTFVASCTCLLYTSDAADE